MKKKLVSFLLILSLALNISSISYASKEYIKDTEIIYNTTILEKNDNIKIESQNINLDLDTEEKGQDGRAKYTYNLENISNEKESIKYSLMKTVENIKDLDISVLKDDKEIDYSIKVGRVLEDTEITKDTQKENKIYEFKENYDFANKDYLPKNYKLGDEVYIYNLSSDEDAEINLKTDDIKYIITNSRDTSNEEFTFEKETVIISNQELEDFKVGEINLKDGINKIKDKSEKEVNLDLKSKKSNMEEAIKEISSLRHLDSKYISELLDNSLKNMDKNIVNFNGFSDELNKIIFIDFDIELNPKESAVITLQTDIDKRYEQSENKGMKLLFIPNPANNQEINNFSIDLNLSKEYNNIEDSNIKFENIEDRKYEFKTDNLKEEEMSIIYKNNKIFTINQMIILAIVLVLIILIFIFIMKKKKNKIEK